MRLHLKYSLYNMLKFLSVHLFDKVIMRETFTNFTYNDNRYTPHKQLNLFDFNETVLFS